MPEPESEPQYEWVDVNPSELRPGDMARGLGHTGLGLGVAGVVDEVDFEYVYLIRLGGWSVRRRWQKRVPATLPVASPEYRWEPIAHDALREGMYVRGVTAPGRDVRSTEGHVTEFRGTNEVKVRPSDGTRRGFVFLDRRTWERRVPANVTAPDGVVPETPQPLGWVPVTDLSTLTVGDIVRATPSGIGGRLQARVTATSDDVFNAMTTHVIVPSRNGAERDRTCYSPQGYVYGDRGHNTEVWRGEGPASEPTQPFAAPRVGEAALPAWATSLDAAERYVHGEAIKLWRQDRNCWDGTSDFLVAAGLPTEEEWPVADESAQIREFLVEVREAALETASCHGKDSDQVRAWLAEHGIATAPPATATHTLTFTTPAGVDAAQALRDLGWTVQL